MTDNLGNVLGVIAPGPMGVRSGGLAVGRMSVPSARGGHET